MYVKSSLYKVKIFIKIFLFTIKLLSLYLNGIIEHKTAESHNYYSNFKAYVKFIKIKSFLHQ